ncbi:MAG: SGNH/GDSL hydrolase family protein [Planctomycetota bacterium]
MKKKLLYLLGIPLAILLVTEVAARVVAHVSPDEVTPQDAILLDLNQKIGAKLFRRHEDSEVCFDLIPGEQSIYDHPGTGQIQQYTVNRHGFRGHDFEETAPAGTYRIALLGDSFVFGLGASDEETLSARMESILAEGGRGHARFEVINSGVPGYHTGQMKAMLLGKTLRMKPDLVVLMVSTNDLIEDSLNYNPATRGLYTDLLPLPYSWKPLLWRVSEAYRMLVAKHAAFLTRTGRVAAYRKGDLDFFHRNVLTIRAEVERRGIGFLIVILPMLENFYSYPYEEHHQWMHAMFEGMDFVDLFPSMRKYDVRGFWFMLHDHHLNAGANRVVANLILEALQTRNLISLDEGSLPDEPFCEPLYSQGDVILLDQGARIEGIGEAVPALFKVDPGSGEATLIARNDMFRKPVDFLCDPFGNLLIMDAEADPMGNNAPGAVFRLNRYLGFVEPIAAPDEFIEAHAHTPGPEGSRFVTERNEDPPNQEDKVYVRGVFDMKTGQMQSSWMEIRDPRINLPVTVKMIPDMGK